MQVKESKWLVKCFLNYLRHDRMEVNVLFDILAIFLHRTRIDFTFLKEFYIIEVHECNISCSPLYGKISPFQVISIQRVLL